MISLASLASEYKAERVDSDGFDLEGEALRIQVERAIRRQLGVYVRIATSLGPIESCPNLFVGELRAAIFGAHVAEQDLAAVAIGSAFDAAQAFVGFVGERAAINALIDAQEATAAA